MVRRLFLAAGLLLLGLLGACALPPASGQDLSNRLDALLPADALLLGEQHDNPDHQRLHRAVIEMLAQGGRLGVVVIEMAERGVSTAQLSAHATEIEVQAALRWDTKSWPWERYAPAVMRAVQVGAVVYGANLPRADMRSAMGNPSLDQRLDAAALGSQREAIRDGHCNLLPESQIAPMTRIQIARDMAMAETLAQGIATAPGKTTVVLAGSAHVDKVLGIPRHLAGGLLVRSVLLSGKPRADIDGASRTVPSGPRAQAFDAVWPTLAIAPKDYCAEFKASRGG